MAMKLMGEIKKAVVKMREIAKVETCSSSKLLGANISLIVYN